MLFTISEVQQHLAELKAQLAKGDGAPSIPAALLKLMGHLEEGVVTHLSKPDTGSYPQLRELMAACISEHLLADPPYNTLANYFIRDHSLFISSGAEKLPITLRIPAQVRFLIDYNIDLLSVTVEPMCLRALDEVEFFLYRRDCFIVDSQELLDAVLAMLGSLEGITLSDNLAKQVTTIPLTRFSDIKLFFKAGGQCGQLPHPSEIDVDFGVGFADVSLTKTDIQYLVDAGAMFFQFPVDACADLAGLLVNNWEQLKSALELGFDVSQCDLSLLTITTVEEFDLAAATGADMHRMELSPDCPIQLVWLDKLHTLQLSLRQYRECCKQAHAELAPKEKLPLAIRFPVADLPDNDKVGNISNPVCLKFMRWLDEVSTLPGISADFKHQIQRDKDYCQRALFGELTKDGFIELIEASHTKKGLFSRVNPNIKILRQWSKSCLGQNITRQNCDALVEIVRDFHRREGCDLHEPKAIVYLQPLHHLYLCLAWILAELGYDTTELRPAALNSIGAVGLPFADIQFENLLLMPHEGALGAFNLQEIIALYDEKRELLNPMDNKPYTDEQALYILNTSPQLYKKVTELTPDMLAKLQERPLLDSKVVERIFTLGKALEKNVDPHFNLARAFKDLTDFADFMSLYPLDMLVLEKLTYYIPRRGQETSWTELFTKARHEGCTQSLNPDILEWIAVFKLNYKAISLFDWANTNEHYDYDAAIAEHKHQLAILMPTTRYTELLQEAQRAKKPLSKNLTTVGHFKAINLFSGARDTISAGAVAQQQIARLTNN